MGANQPRPFDENIYVHTQIAMLLFWVMYFFFVIIEFIFWSFVELEPKFDTGILALSLFAHAVTLFVCVFLFGVFYRLSPEPTKKKRNVLRWLIRIGITFILLNWLVQLHLVGSQSSVMLLPIAGTMCVAIWFSTFKETLFFFPLAVLGPFAVTFLEYSGVLTYAPILSGGVDTSVFLDWRMIAGNTCIFIVVLGSVCSILLMFRKRLVESERFYREASVALTEELLKRAAVEEELRRLATMDPLTDTYNRRYFWQAAGEEVERAERYHRDFSVIVLDVDHFKQVNDTWGHGVGDLALKEVTKTCVETLRENDVFGRLGGEEFGVLLPETDSIAAEQVAERLRQEVASISIPTDEEVLKLTISLGVACLEPDEANFETLLSRADQALYRAKGAGRNRVVVAT